MKSNIACVGCNLPPPSLQGGHPPGLGNSARHMPVVATLVGLWKLQEGAQEQERWQPPQDGNDQDRQQRQRQGQWQRSGNGARAQERAKVAENAAPA
jgi:hypothetical protein